MAPGSEMDSENSLAGHAKAASLLKDPVEWNIGVRTGHSLVWMG